ncbi:DUF1810 domain-containing protein [Pseudoduganella namucuonensis]|uniref:Uncharacterized protein, DUF1810 family n=1 Tax=Pseudoduganella namucuonensis TaxID=1035707 RepID=A0A1I7JN29_9BURK|nr:DUF1810 domain-containing protein [Pseudoduganella namucuonensis]SFU86563.1 Uncharacterized protein, DUF1810 family [Pseudoduganella namucuonensis]
MFELERFLEAQAPVYSAVLRELSTGRKRSHWMWFIFPQLAGLGHSAMAQRYAISGLAEARAYLAHPVLGPRLRECSELVAAVPDASAHDIFGSPDDLKFRSCMTLFARAAPGDAIFQRCLDSFFSGHPDPATLAML